MSDDELGLHGWRFHNGQRITTTERHVYLHSVGLGDHHHDVDADGGLILDALRVKLQRSGCPMCGANHSTRISCGKFDADVHGVTYANPEGRHLPDRPRGPIA